MATSIQRVANGAGETVGWAVVLDMRSTLAEFPTVEKAVAYETAYNGGEFRTIESLPVGEYYKRTPTSKTVYVRGAYNRSTKAYETYKADDINDGGEVRGKRIVFVGFTY